MPIFRIETNIVKGKIPSDYHKLTTVLIAKILGKPEEACAVSIIPDTAITRGGSNEPCAFGTLISIGKLGAEENRKHAAAIFDHVEKQLGIPKDRFVLHFIDENANNIGHKGTTMEELRSCSK